MLRRGGREHSELQYRLGGQTVVAPAGRPDRFRGDSMLDQDVEVCDVLVLGAGVGGLAAASQLGRRAIVLERADRPGGLVRTECFNGYWFDHVVHLLYFPDEDPERRIRAVMGDLLVPCPPEAWVETKVGTTRYPLQMHLGALPPKCVLRCLQDLANVTFNSHADQPPRNFEQMLERTFGRALCELFFFPYNRKVWKRPLDELAPSGFTWTITHPEFDDVLAGALLPNCRYRSYNAAGYYPQSRIGAPLRGMELLSHRLATSVHDLRLGHRVDSIDLERREVTVHDGVGQRRFRYRQCCCCSLPLPRVLDMCVQTPAG
ncbi:MAG: FAD-dependent oxidoreductase, partial [Proteobacteria bacterium]|nr:FAD-dependent oxidoreductase [Pseudomonadota bacterium]